MAFNKPSSGDTVLHTDITQLIEALDGSAADGAGEPIKITKVNDAVNYALDIVNQDAVNSYGLRVRNHAGNVVFRTTDDYLIVAKDIVLESGVMIDDLLPVTHNHNASAGMGVQIPSGGLAANAVIAGKIADGAVNTAAKIVDGIITFAKMAVTPAANSDLTTHTGAGSAVHGLGAGVYVVGCKQAQKRIETKTGSKQINKYSTDTITVTWDNAFSGTPVVASMIGVTSGIGRVEAMGAVSVSTTGASHTLNTGDGDAYCTVTENFIAVGA